MCYSELFFDKLPSEVIEAKNVNIFTIFINIRLIETIDIGKLIEDQESASNFEANDSTKYYLQIILTKSSLFSLNNKPL